MDKSKLIEKLKKCDMLPEDDKILLSVNYLLQYIDDKEVTKAFNDLTGWYAKDIDDEQTERAEYEEVNKMIESIANKSTKMYTQEEFERLMNSRGYHA